MAKRHTKREYPLKYSRFYTKGIASTCRSWKRDKVDDPEKALNEARKAIDREFGVPEREDPDA